MTVLDHFFLQNMSLVGMMWSQKKLAELFWVLPPPKKAQSSKHQSPWGGFPKLRGAPNNFEKAGGQVIQFN